MIKISVIVPLYNAESYISKCLDSLVNQTYQNMEIIVIDDASTDNSANIVKEYADKYNNIIFIQNKENKKTFETKRIGMETATGDYIGFCDSDDYHDTNSFEYMLNRIQEKDYDMVTVSEMNQNIIEHSYNNGELFYSLIKQKERYLMPASLFKKEVIKKAISEIDHYIKAAHGEDHLWRLIILYYTKSSLHTSLKLYCYTPNQESISKNYKDININISRIQDDSLVLEEMKQFLIKKNIGKEYIQLLVNNFYIFPLKSLDFLKKSTNDYINIWFQHASDDIKKSLINFYHNEINKYKNQINKYKNDIIKNNKINIADIILSISFNQNYTLFRIFGIKITFKKNISKLERKLLKKQKNKYNIDINNFMINNYNISYQNSNLGINSEAYYVTFLFNSKFLYNISASKNNIDLFFKHGFDNLYKFYDLIKNKLFLIEEDGFIRSTTTWVNKSMPIKYRYSIAFTFSNYPHFYAKEISRLEYLINNNSIVIDTYKINRAKKCIKKIIDNKISKYNHQPIYIPNLGNKNRKKVLVIDQSYGDKSIEYGMADDNTFKLMLKKAIEENPNYDVIIKTHPDALAENTKRKMTYYTKDDVKDNVYLLTEEINPISLLEIAEKVYVCTSQFGFEALMMGKEVHTFGMPFYAGWGVTIDYQKCKRRKMKRTVEEIFYIAYIMYTYYVNPDTEKRCEIEEAIDYLIKLRKEYFLEYNVRCDEKSLIE